MSTEVSRDPSDYRLTIHAGQRRRERDIPPALIAETIEEGELRNTHEEETRLFVADYPETDAPVGVTVDVESGDVLTVTWRD